MDKAPGKPGVFLNFIIMTDLQIQLVQQSWSLVKPISTYAGLLFYEKLFNKAPGIRHLFKDDIAEQANKLVMILGFVVSRLHRLDDIMAEVQKLGQRHNQYGAQPVHYDVVGSCLIETLAEGLQENWSADIEEAWLMAFGIIKNAMIEAQQSQTFAA